MKILFDVDHAFSWAHGGIQNLVENFMIHLPKFGIDVEPLKWWDKHQEGDIIHTFYKPGNVLKLAKNKNIKIICSIFLDGVSSRGSFDLFLRRLYIKTLKPILRNSAADLGWEYGEIADGYIYPSKHEVRLGNYLYDAKLDKSFDSLYGVESKYFADRSPNSKKDYLISINTIHPRKNNIQLAKLALKAKIQIKFLGKPYSEDSYFNEFKSYVDNKYVIYEGYVSDEEKQKYLKIARGLITLSFVESGCIAVLEAFASDCPVFLPDLAWAKSLYNGYAAFGDLKNEKKLMEQLKRFYACPEESHKKFPVLTWDQACLNYIAVYKKVLGQ